MGWFLWGMALGWSACAIYHYSQSENEKIGNGATIVAGLIFFAAIVISINLGIASGAIAPGTVTPAPTSLGR